MGVSILPRETAVLFIDFQVDVCARGGRMVSQEPEVLARFEAARGAAGRVLQAIRAKPDAAPHHAFVCHGFEPGYPELGEGSQPGMAAYVRKMGAFVRGDPGTELVPELAARPGERVLWKHTISAFAGTDVPRWLASRHVRTVVVAGVVTHYAVLAATLSAHDAGYQVLVLRDCCASGDPARHETALEIMAPLATAVDADAFIAGW